MAEQSACKTLNEMKDIKTLTARYEQLYPIICDLEKELQRIKEDTDLSWEERNKRKQYFEAKNKEIYGEYMDVLGAINQYRNKAE